MAVGRVPPVARATRHARCGVLTDALGIEGWALVTGGSLGGMVSLEVALAPHGWSG